MTGDTERFYLVAVFFVLNPVFFSVSHAQSDAADYLCTKNGVTRQIAVVRDSGYACRVKYTRSSGITYPWNARSEAGYCGPKAASLAERLGSFGWACVAANDTQTADEVQEVLLAQLERYERHIRILDNVGKTCHFYPADAQYGNLCGDGYAEAAIVYTCEGEAGDWEQHLAVFIDTEEKPLIREVGSSGSRQVTGYYIDGNRLTIESDRSLGAGDGAPPGEPAVTMQIGCRYDAANRWELFEQQ